MTSNGKYPSAARHGWGQTAMLLHPKLASLGKLGKHGGRLDAEQKDEPKAGRRNSTRKVDQRKMKELMEKTDEKEDEFLFSNRDLFLFIGFFLFSAGLVVTILLMPFPNMWLQNEDMIYVSAGLILLGTLVFLGAVLPCFISCLYRLICCKQSKKSSQNERKVITVNPRSDLHDEDVEELIAAVYDNKHKAQVLDE